MGKGDINRQKIVAAADDLFYRQGYVHTSFSDIADAAGIPRGNFYYYFKTKDEILAAVIDQRARNLGEMLEAWEAELADPRDRLRRYVDMLTAEQEHIEQYGCPMGSLCTELAKLRHALQSDAARMFEVVRAWLERQLKALGRTRDARQLALHLLARGQGIALITNAYRDRAFLQREARELKRWIDAL